MSSIVFEKSNNINSEFKVLSAKTKDDEKSIKVVLNQPATAVNLNLEDFKVYVNSSQVAVSAVYLDEATLRYIVLELDDYLYYQDQIKVNYSGTNLKTTNNLSLPSFTNYSVDNTLLERAFIPDKIQAEDFYMQVGLETENTSDNGAGQNIGYTDDGDYATYKVFVSEDGNYQLDIRNAAENTVGEIAFELSSEDNTETLGNVSLPITGGWQSWQTTSTDVILKKGIYTLKMEVIKAGFNLNWFEFTYKSSLSTSDTKLEKVTIYPNPTADYFHLKTSGQTKLESINLVDISGRVLQILKPKENNSKYKLSTIKTGVYFLIVKTNRGVLKKKLIKQ